MPLPGIGLGVGLATGIIGSIGKLFGRKKANRQMDQLLAQDPKYTENPLARQQLGLATTLLNARMPGSAAAERNIYVNQANQLARLDRGATDASQALAVASGIGGQTNQAFNELGMNEAQDYQRRYGNLVGAQQGLISEQDKVFNDDLRRYGDKVAVMGAKNENRQNSWGDISNFGFGLANFAASGGLNSMGRSQNQYNPRMGATSSPRSSLPDVRSGSSPASQMGQIPYRPLQRPTGVPYQRNYNYNSTFYPG